MKSSDLLIVILVALLVVFLGYRFMNENICGVCPREGFDSTCSPCYGNSTGRCQNPVNNVCYEKPTTGDCYPGTILCPGGSSPPSPCPRLTACPAPGPTPPTPSPPTPPQHQVLLLNPNRV